MRVIIMNLMVRNLLSSILIFKGLKKKYLLIYLFVCLFVLKDNLGLNTSLLLKTVLKESLTRQKNIILQCWFLLTV